MREIRQSGSEGGGTKPIASPYPYQKSFLPRRKHLGYRKVIQIGGTTPDWTVCVTTF